MDNHCDAWLKQFYAVLPFEQYIQLDRAARTLEANSGSRRTGVKYPWDPLRGMIPSDGYFAGVWNWDSAFHAMGVCRWDPEFARDQIRIMMKIQLENGMFPDVWRCPKGEIFAGCTKPPVLPWACWFIEKMTGASSDSEFLKSAYAAFKRNETFWRERRGGAVDGLFHYDGESEKPEERKLFGGWESGWDDSPRWDGGVNNTFPVDLNCYMVLFYRAMRDFSVTLNLTADTAIWKQREAALTHEIETRLWDAEGASYFDFDFVGKKFARVLTPASFMPLLIGIAPADHARAMAKMAERMSPGWPSVAYDESTYDPMGYWRGRTWLNIAYFALKGLKRYGYSDLAETGRRTLLKWVANDPGSIYENYNSQNGLPAGAPHFGWSSAFVIKFLLDWELSVESELPAASKA